MIQKNFLRALHAILFTAPLFKNIFLRHCNVLVRWMSWLGMTDLSSDDTAFHPLRLVVHKLVDQNLYLMHTTLLHLIPVYFSDYADMKDIATVILYELMILHAVYRFQ